LFSRPSLNRHFMLIAWIRLVLRPFVMDVLVFLLQFFTRVLVYTYSFRRLHQTILKKNSVQ